MVSVNTRAIDAIILDYINVNFGTLVNIQHNSEIAPSHDDKVLRIRAIGLTTKTIDGALKTYTKLKIPTFYRIMGPLFILSALAAVVLLYVDLYLAIFCQSISFYTTWMLCSLSMYFTNRSAIKDWKKRNGK